MDAWIGLIGVAVGVAGTLAVTVYSNRWQAKREDARLRFERDQAHSEWMRTKRESAYEEFIAGIFTLKTKIEHRVHDLKTGGRKTQPLSEEAVHPINLAMIRVLMYCSNETKQLANDMWVQAAETSRIAFAADDVSQLDLIENLMSVLAEDLVKFREAVRRDLGTTG